MNKKYHVVHSEDKISEIAVVDNQLVIGGKNVDWDIVSLSGDKKNIIINNTNYNIEIESVDIEQKRVSLSVNGKSYSFKIREEIDIQLNSMGMLNHKQIKVDNIKAPMPGLVVKIMVEEGQEVEKGDAIIVLEAMKMENVIKAAGPGKIKKINVTNKEAVEKNAVLIEME
jgi:acetyl/propionyl-CoA carboxylase alpha subunit